MSFVTVGDLRQYLAQINRLTPADASANDALLQAILDRAQSIVDGALGFTYAGYTAAASRSILSYGGNYLELPPYRLGSITSVMMGGTTYTDYTITPRGNLYRAAGWATWGTWGPPSWWWVDVTAEWGYGDPPASIVEVVLELAVNLWRGKDRGMFTEVVGTESGGAVVVPLGGLNKNQREIVENVKNAISGSYGI